MGTDVYNVVVTRKHKLVKFVQFDAKEHTREASFVAEFRDNSTIYDDCTGVVREDMIDDIIIGDLGIFKAPSKDGETWLDAGSYSADSDGSGSSPCITNMPMEAFAKTITYDEGRQLSNTGSSMGTIIIMGATIIIVIGIFVATKK